MTFSTRWRLPKPFGVEGFSLSEAMLKEMRAGCGTLASIAQIIVTGRGASMES